MIPRPVSRVRYLDLYIPIGMISKAVANMIYRSVFFRPVLSNDREGCEIMSYFWGRRIGDLSDHSWLTVYGDLWLGLWTLCVRNVSHDPPRPVDIAPKGITPRHQPTNHGGGEEIFIYILLQDITWYYLLYMTENRPKLPGFLHPVLEKIISVHLLGCNLCH